MRGHRYRVKNGDSLATIADSQLGHAKLWPRIFAYNNRRDVQSYTRHRLTDPDKLSVGELLLIPPPESGHGRAAHQASRRHPRQTTHPKIAATTKTAVNGAPAGLPQPPSATPPQQGPTSPSAAAPGGGAGGGSTTVNSFPFKYKLDVIPKQVIEGPNYTATLKFDGSVTIWLDKQIPVLTLTNKGAEAAAKSETDGVFAKLIQNEKISWEPGSKKATFEDMLTLNAHGAPPSLSSTGIAVESDNLIPALRFKFAAPTLQGKLGQHVYVAENFTVTVDLRPKADDPDITRRADPVRVAPRPVAIPQPEHWWQKAGTWVADHKVEIGVAVLVTAVVASNFVTVGADAEADPAVALWAARTVQAARAARAASALAPEFAN